MPEEEMTSEDDDYDSIMCPDWDSPPRGIAVAMLVSLGLSVAGCSIWWLLT